MSHGNTGEEFFSHHHHDHDQMRMNEVQPGGGCRGKCSRVATAGTTKPGDDDLVDGFDVDDLVDHVVDDYDDHDDPDDDDQLTYYLEVDSTVVDDAVVVDVHDVKNVHTCK